MSDAREYVIWSFEHDAWWKAGGWGYTQYLVEAGRYDKAEAEAIVHKANRFVATPHEQAILLTTAVAYVVKGWHPLTPGTYDDGKGGLHFVIDEMLAGHGYADTPENRQMLIESAREMMSRDGTPVEVIE